MHDCIIATYIATSDHTVETYHIQKGNAFLGNAQ